MWSARQGFTLILILIACHFIGPTTSWGLEDIPGKETSIYSPVIQVVPDHNGKGFIRVSTQGGVLWVEASEAAKPHLSELPVGSLIDITIVFRGKPTPPLIKSWRLASGDSPCPIFDGQQCLTTDKQE